MQYLILLVSIFLISCESKIKSPTHLNLNGDWQFRKIGNERWTKATVPGVVQLDMLNAGLIEDPFYGENENKIGWIELNNWEYKRNFNVDPAILNQDIVELVFEGLDTYAEVKINGKQVLNANNMFCSWRVNCKKELNPGKNTISVLFKSPIKENEQKYNALGYQLPASNDAGQLKVSPFVRKAPYHFGWDWGPRIVTMGIWRPVRLECYSLAKLKDVYFEQKSVETDWARVSCQISLDVIREGEFELILKDDDIILVQKTINTQKGLHKYTLDFAIEKPQLWWSNGLGKPHLYNWHIELKHKTNVLSSQKHKIGLRKIELIQETDSIGTNYYFKLNGVPLFMKGANYIPQDNFLPRVKSLDYKKLIENAVDANMNMLRVWGGGIYEDDIFYNLCDENGILVWQDFMFACSMYPGDKDFLSSVQKEINQNVTRLRNHACIALWCGNNEVQIAWQYWGWQEKFGYSLKDSSEIAKSYNKLFKELIPSELEDLKTHRDYVPTSPLSNWGRSQNFNHHSMHYWGVWHGDEPFESYKKNIGRFMSEYGFQSFPEMKSIRLFADSSQWFLDSDVMKHHQKSYIGNGMIKKHMDQYFPLPNTFKEFVYLSQLTQRIGIETAINSHRKTRRCMGTLYWQLNDCWPGPSWSGIDYYGRWKALHYKVKTLYDDILIIIDQIEKSDLEIIISSDRLTNSVGNLNLELISFDGDKIWEKIKTITINKNASQVVFKKDFVNLLKANKANKLFLKVTIEIKGENYHQIYYFKKPKELNLSEAHIQKQIRKTTEGYELELYSPNLVKDLFIQVYKKEIQCSDNFFDLLPNNKKVIEIKTSEKLVVDDITFLSINQLLD